MNGKRILAIVGLVFMAASILLIIAAGVFNQQANPLLSLSGISFLVSVAVFVVLKIIKKEEEEDKAAQQPDEQGE